MCRRHAPIAPDARSCCCPAAPAAQVIIPSGGTRFTETELLFCAHHLRRSTAGLRALGVAVYDQRGDLLDGVAALFARDR